MKHRRFWDSVDDALLIYQGLSQSLHAMKEMIKEGASARVPKPWTTIELCMQPQNSTLADSV